MSFQTFEDFKRDYIKLNGTMPMSPYATSAYDTVWTVALTIANLFRHNDTDLGSVPYRDANEVMKAVEGLMFEGLSVSLYTLHVTCFSSSLIFHIRILYIFYRQVREG